MKLESIKKVRSNLLRVSIVTVSLTALLLISAIFIKDFFENYLLRSILLTCAVISAASFFANSAFEVFPKTRVLSLISLGLLGIASVLALIIFWANFKLPEVLGKVIGIISITACFFTMIVTTNAKLGSNYLALKYSYFAGICIIDFVLFALILGWNVLKDGTVQTLFGILCLIVFAMMCVCNILAKKVRMDENDDELSKKDEANQNLVMKVQELESENRELKAQIAELKEELEKYQNQAN